MDTRLVEQVVSARKALKQKYNSLKSDIAKSQSALEKSYKPITQPLQELLTTLKPASEIKKEVKEEEEPLADLFKSFQKQYYQTVPQDPEETYQYEPSLHPEESYFDDSLARPPTRLELEEKQLEQYLNHFHSPLPRTYIDDQIRSANKDDFDYTFGVHYDIDKNKFVIGSTPITFEGADFVIEGLKYPGTPGLYELMFKKHPVGYKSKDVDNYIDIIRRNNVHYLEYNPEKGVNTSNAPKFKNIIKPQISTIHFLTQQKELQKQKAKEERERGLHLSPIDRPRKGSLPNTEMRKLRPRTGSIPTRAPLSSTRLGRNLNMMEFNNKMIEYRYFDDPNEIVDRLKLLIASQNAGNTSHNNEILSIVEELREAKIIA